MKNSLSRLCICIIAVLAAAACEKESSTVPEFNVSQALTVASTAGTYSFVYSVSNPVSGGQISGSASVSWLTDIDVSVEGTVSFAVAEYIGDDLRSGDIILTYTYSGGSVRERVGVVQLPSGGFALSLSPSGVTAPLNGGHCSFSYTVADIASDGEISCTSDVSWIGDFDCSEPGTVTFFVDPNESMELRTGNITVVYSYLGASESRTVTVVQDHRNAGYTTLDSVIGTYEATGISTSAGHKETTWTLTVMSDGDGGLYIDGLVPTYSGKYAEYGDHRYSAKATLTEDMIIVPFQVSSTTVSTSSGTAYFGYMACTQYNEDRSSYSYGKSSATFSYNRDENTWTSDHGSFAAAFSDPTGEGGISTIFIEYYDITIPGVVLRKID